MTQTFAGLSSLNLPSRFDAAERRIILHAAVYGPFAKSIPHRDGLKAALDKDSFLSLDVIALDNKQPWATPFMRAIRFGEDSEAHLQTFRSSLNFMTKLKDAHPKKVNLHRQLTTPCLPIIVIDDTILFGQYAHCEARAAEGFWGVIETDVNKLSSWASGNGLPSEATAEETAAYRLISECHHAMNGDMK